MAAATIVAAGVVAGPVGATTTRPSAEPIQLYVSPDGSADGSGSIDDPFADLQQAQRAVRELTADMASDVIVNLRGGTYPADEPLDLENASGDSGENGHRVAYQAYGYGTEDQEVPVISGGRAIDGWRLSDPTKNIWRADVGALNTRQLYRSGEALERGSIKRLPGKATRTKTGYTTTSTVPQIWSNPGDLEVRFTTVGYQQGICGIDRITGSAKHTEITMDQPCFNRLVKTFTFNGENPAKPVPLVKPTRIQNGVSLLRRPGTWAIDRSREGHHRIYYRAAAGERPEDRRFVVPVRQSLVRGAGTRSNPLHDISFRGLTFTYGTWLRPSSRAGFVHMFGDYVYYGGSPSGGVTEPTARFGYVPGNLSFEHTADLLFEGNRFTRLGGDGLKLIGTRDNVIRGNEFTDLAGGGLKLDGTGSGDDGDNLIENNWIHAIGTDYASIAIYLEQIVDTTARHNQINAVPYSGIVSDIAKPKYAHGNRILNNQIFDTVNVLMDGGGIYTAKAQGSSYGNGGLIRGNLIHGTVNASFAEQDPHGKIGAPNGLYTDVDADFITLRRNVVYDNHQSWGGVTPKRMRFKDNYWDDDKLVWYGPTKGLRIGHNTLLGASSPRRDCLADDTCRSIVRSAGLTPSWARVLQP